MDGNLVLGIIQIVMIVVMGWIAWARLPYQTTLDKSAAVEHLSDSLDKALIRQKELEKIQTELEGRIKDLNRILSEKNYSVTMVFQLGEQPIVKSVTIQPVLVTPVK
jgi:hypothetical protein